MKAGLGKLKLSTGEYNEYNEDDFWFKGDGGDVLFDVEGVGGCLKFWL